MEWKDEAVILSARRYGENKTILEAMTASYGRCLGLVNGATSKNMRCVLQPGNLVELNWRARLDEHLGNFRIEPIELRAAFLFETRLGVFGVQTLVSHLRLLPERDPSTSLYKAFNAIILNLEDTLIAGELLVHFEINLLEEMGFGLDLNTCALTGEQQELVWVSPRSGRAVSREPGAPWENRLLKLPSFLIEKYGERPVSLKAVLSGLKLTGFFLNRRIYKPRGINMPYERNSFIDTLCIKQKAFK